MKEASEDDKKNMEELLKDFKEDILYRQDKRGYANGGKI